MTEKAPNGTVAYVHTMPKCNFPHYPGDAPDATYDFRTKSGQWAFGCDPHYMNYRMHEELGTGKGQKLEVRAGEVKTS